MMPLLWAIEKVFILQRNSKKRSVWAKGCTNSGKTEIYKIIKKIFISEDIPDNDSKFFPP